jgi:hypothetical protein
MRVWQSKEECGKKSKNREIRKEKQNRLTLDSIKSIVFMADFDNKRNSNRAFLCFLLYTYTHRTMHTHIHTFEFAFLGSEHSITVISSSHWQGSGDGQYFQLINI